MNRLEGPEILKSYNIRLITRSQSAGLLQSVTLGNVQRRHGNQVFRLIAVGHTDLQQVVDAALLDQIVRMAVIGTQAKPAVIRPFQYRKQVNQIVSRAAFPQEHVHAPFNFFKGFRRCHALMLCRNSGRHIGIQFLAGNSRGMPIHLLFVEQLQLIHFQLLFIQNSGEVHHFCQTQHPGT